MESFRLPTHPHRPRAGKCCTKINVSCLIHQVLSLLDCLRCCPLHVSPKPVQLPRFASYIAGVVQVCNARSALISIIFRLGFVHSLTSRPWPEKTLLGTEWQGSLVRHRGHNIPWTLSLPYSRSQALRRGIHSNIFRPVSEGAARSCYYRVYCPALAVDRYLEYLADVPTERWP